MLGIAVAIDPLARLFTADQVLSPYIYVFYAAFIVSFLFTPIMRVVANYYGIVDRPDMIRKLHDTPVAYLGGVAVFVGWMAGLAISQFTQMHTNEPSSMSYVRIPFSLILGGIVIVILGLFDDIRKVRPAVKIIGQMLAATFLLIRGVGRHAADPILNPINARLMIRFHVGIPPEVCTLLSALFVYLVVVGCCNATNLMDGLDGLCGGVTAVMSAGFLFLAVHIAQTSGAFDPNLDALRVVLALALLGAVLGFVPFNFNPASIFMGDTGSMLLGYASAAMILLSAQGATNQTGDPKWFLASMVMFALPILDTSLAFARRWVNGRPLFSPDRNHLHHQLVARGFSVKQTVLLSYGLATVFAVLGGLIAFMRTRYAVAFYLVIFGSIIVAAYKMGMVHENVPVPAKKRRSVMVEDEIASLDAARPDDVNRAETPRAAEARADELQV